MSNFLASDKDPQQYTSTIYVKVGMVIIRTGLSAWVGLEVSFVIIGA